MFYYSYFWNIFRLECSLPILRLNKFKIQISLSNKNFETLKSSLEVENILMLKPTEVQKQTKNTNSIIIVFCFLSIWFSKSI